jgi:F0F1-type ATP synthase assembly protein I
MRILLGLWLLQAVSAGLAWLALSSASSGQIIVWIGVVMCVGLLAALWFWTALRDQRRLGEVQRSERMANGVAELHAKLARQRAEDAAKLRTLAERAAETRPKWLKTGFVAGVALGLGLALMLMQFVTLGLFAVAFTGGGVAGYVMRGRLHRRAASRSGAAISVGAASPDVVDLPKPRSKSPRLRLLKPRAA